MKRMPIPRAAFGAVASLLVSAASSLAQVKTGTPSTPPAGANHSVLEATEPAKAPLLIDAIKAANRRIIESTGRERDDVAACLAGEFAVRAEVVNIERVADNVVRIHAAISVQRPQLRYAPSAEATAEIAAAEQNVIEVRRSAERELAEFDSQWVRGPKRTKAGQMMIWRNRAYPRKQHLSDAQHAGMRSAIRDRTREGVLAAQRDLDQLRKTQQQKRDAAEKFAMRVQLRISASDGALEQLDLNRVQATQRVSAITRVVNCELGPDEPEWLGGGDHVVSIEAVAVARDARK
jgi:hypothetical protein